MKCEQSLLEEGQNCYNETELEDYLANLKISVGYLHNYIDYEDIENPVKTILIPKT